MHIAFFPLLLPVKSRHTFIRHNPIRISIFAQINVSSNFHELLLTPKLIKKTVLFFHSYCIKKARMAPSKNNIIFYK